MNLAITEGSMAKTLKSYLENDELIWHSEYKGFTIYKQEYNAKAASGVIIRREMFVGIKDSIRITCLTNKDLRKFIKENY